MVMQKVSVNTPISTSFGAAAVTQGQQTVPAQPRKDYTKAIGWVAAGLATAGLAGVWIYNARKGRASASDPLTGVGTYVRKFLDESIFAKSAEAVSNGAKDVALKVSTDGNDWQLCHYTQGFGCHMVKKVPDGRTDVPNFQFSSGALDIKMFNESTDAARFDFRLGQDDDFLLSVNVDSWRGKVSKSVASGYGDNYNFTNEQCQSILENLDMKRLVDEPSYRATYTQSLYQKIGDMVKKTKFQKIAERTGKTFDDVQSAFGSKEFNRLLDVQDMLWDIHYRYGVANSEAFASIKDKDSFGMLEDFVSGNSKLNIIDDFVETDVRFPADKTCYELSIPSADGSGVLEHLRFSHDNEYLLYERFNPDDAADRLKIRCYYPELDDTNSCITDFETKGASFFMESTKSGRNRVEVTHPTSTEPLKFYFNSNREWNADIDYGDELEPYMGYIEKIAKTLSDEEENWKFLHDFATKGQELLEELAK